MSDPWQMPEPVFRTSEGEIVEARPRSEAAPIENAAPSEDAAALEALYAPPDEIKPADTGSEPEAVPIAAAPAAPAGKEAGGAITDQPYVSEEYDVEEINAAVVAATPARKSKGSLIFKLLAAAVVLGALAVAVIFLAWFLFMRPTE